jgi:hypothetical protein
MASTLTDDQIVEILEDIIQNSAKAQARIAAIRVWREMADQVPDDGVAELDRYRPRAEGSTSLAVPPMRAMPSGDPLRSRFLD